MHARGTRTYLRATGLPRAGSAKEMPSAATTSPASAISHSSSLVSRKTLVNQLGRSKIAASSDLCGSAELSVAAPRANRPASVKNVHHASTIPTGTAGAADRIHRDGLDQGKSAA